MKKHQQRPSLCAYLMSLSTFTLLQLGVMAPVQAAVLGSEGSDYGNPGPDFVTPSAGSHTVSGTLGPTPTDGQDQFDVQIPNTQTLQSVSYTASSYVDGYGGALTHSLTGCGASDSDADLDYTPSSTQFNCTLNFNINTDFQTSSFTWSVIITTADIVNDAPTDISLSTTTTELTLDPTYGFYYNTAITVSGTDPNSGDTLSYSLVSDGASDNGSCGTSGDDNNSDFDFNFDDETLLVSYNNLALGDYNICLQVADQYSWSYQKAFVITIGPANATPSLAIADASLAITEGDAAHVLDSAATLSDTDGDTDWDGGTLVAQVTGNSEADDELSVPDNLVGSINTSGTDLFDGVTSIGTLSASEGTVTGATALTITFNSSATNALVQQVLRAFSYRHTGDAPATSKTITVTATDTNNGSASDARTVSITAVNDAPSVQTNTGITLDEGALQVIGAVQLSAQDPDDSGTGLIFTVTALPAVGALFIDANANDALDSGEALSLPSSATFTQQDIADSNLYYQHDGSESTSDTFSFTLADGLEDGVTAVAGQSFAITITPRNEAPTLVSNTGFSASDINEGASATISQSHLEYTDVDDVPNALTYTVTAIPSYGVLRASASALGISDSFTQQAINDGLISYLHDGSENFNDSFSFTLADGLEDGVTAITGQSFAIAVQSVNDAPVITGLPTDLNFSEDSSGQLDLSAVSFSDADSSALTVTLTISEGTFAAPADGSGIGAGVTATLVSSTTMTLQGSPDDINSYLDSASNLQYTGASNASGDNRATLSITMNDGNGSGDLAGGSSNIDIAAVNDAPTAIVLSATQLNQSQVLNQAASVGTLTTTDVDLTDTHTYTLVAPAVSDSGSCSSAADNGLFSINTDNLVVASGIAPGLYSVCVQSSDGAVSYQQTFSITIVDDVAPEAPTISTPIAGDDTVNAAEDNSVLVNGTGAEANADVTVRLSDGSNSQTINVTADGTGSWSLSGQEADISSFINGSIAIEVTQTDAANNTSTAATATVTLDNTAPASPAITTPIANDNVVNAAEDANLVIEGSGAEANATVTVTISDGSQQLTETVTADGTGLWTLDGQSFDISAFNNGSITVTVNQTDAAGNTSADGSATISLDSQVPVAPAVNTPIENDDVVNASEDGDVLIEGSGAEANATVTVVISDGSNSLSETVTADGSGNWTLNGQEFDIANFNNGSVTVAVTQTDAAGNASADGSATITLDNQAPVAPTVNTPIEADGVVNASEDSDVLIEGGGAEANASVTVVISDGSNTLSETVTADGSGNWTLNGQEFDIANFNNGSVTIAVTQTDAAGNASADGSAALTLDNQAPAAPTVTTPIEVDDAVNASEDSDVLIEGGGAEANASVTVVVSDGSNTLSETVTADGSGDWTLNGQEFDIASFNNGSVTIAVTQTDAAGNASAESNATVTLDNAAPAAPVISAPIEIDNIVNASEDDTVVINGSGAEPNASLQVDIGGVTTTVTADGNGNWSLESQAVDISGLTNGSVTITVTQTDAAGNTSTAATATVTLDNNAPAAPAITTPIANDNVVNAAEDTNLVIEGSGAEANATVTVTISDGVNQLTETVAADGAGLWTLDGQSFDISAFDNGSITVTVNQTDAAGNTSVDGSATITLDNQVPAAPTVTTPIEGDDAVNASEDSDVLIEGGGAEANASVTVVISDGSNTLSETVTADGSGNWTLNGQEFDIANFNNGSVTIAVTQTDAAGNASADGSGTLTLDNQAPAAPTVNTPIEGDDAVNASEDTDVLIEGGGAEANASVTVVISDGSNTLSETVTADGSGDWTLNGQEFDIASFNNGSVTITVNQADAAGNTSAASNATVTLDNTPPSAPQVATPIAGDDRVSADEDSDFRLDGSGAEANATVTIAITDGINTVQATITADSDGNWTSDGQPLDLSGFTNGELTIRVTQIDGSGNVSVPAEHKVVLDNQVPASPSINLPIANDNQVNSAEIQNLVIDGAGAEPNATVTITVNGVQVEVQADANGQWTTDGAGLDLSGLTDGSATITVTQTDAAGNRSTIAESEVVIDQSAPSAPTINSPIAGDDRVNIAEQSAIEISGAAAEANAEVAVKISDGDTQLLVTVIADSAGAWAVVAGMDVTGLNDGSLEVTASQADAAGNISPAASATVIKDTQEPSIATVDVPAGDYRVGDTLDITLTLDEAVSVDGVNSMMTLDVGGVEQQASFVSATATTLLYSYSVSDGDNDSDGIAVIAIDLKGDAISDVANNPLNVQLPSAEYAARVDTAAPETAVVTSHNDTVVLNADSFLITGSHTEDGITVELYRDANNDGLADSATPLDTALIVDEIWQFSVELLADMAHDFVVQVVDAAGNRSPFADVPTLLEDSAAPATFTASIDAPVVTANNETSIVVDLAGVELGTSYQYVISDENNNSVTGTGVVSSGNQSIDGIDLSALSEGVLTLTVTLTDAAGNQTSLLSDTIDKQYQRPPSIDQGDEISVAMSEDGAPQSFALTLSASDINADPLSWAVSGAANSGLASVEGTGNQVVVSYQPALNFNGLDSFTVTVSDGQDSDVITVNVAVASVNDLPTIQGESLSPTRTEDNSYLFDVLANDRDADGDTLLLESARASVGLVSIVDGQLRYQAPNNFSGSVTITYSVRDGNGGRAQGQAAVVIAATSSTEPPRITVPSAVTVDAVALFTKVNLGVATAVDARGRPVPVSLVDGVTVFPPGRNTAYWQAVDAMGNTAIAEQAVVVHPLVSLSKDQVVAEGSRVNVLVLLNGVAPEYPVEIPFTVSGSATAGVDYSELSGNVVITKGTQAVIPIDIAADAVVEDDETIIISLNDQMNIGAKHVTTLRISEANIPPKVELTVSQADQDRLSVSQQEGNVLVIAKVSDPNPNDTVSYQWQADPAIVDVSFVDNIFEFAPNDVPLGVYPISFIATDSAGATEKQTVYIDIQPSLQMLSSDDSDGDLIPDDQEGYADSDGDGIADYLDSISECNVVPHQARQERNFLIEGDPGVCLRRGAVSAISQTGGLLLDDDQERNTLNDDSELVVVGGAFDFIAYGLPESGQSYKLVMPQKAPIPAGGAYRKYAQSVGWFEFVEDEFNKVSSTLGEPGYCPPPGDTSWSAGLTEGHWCVQLEVQDGGPNDDDGLANGAIADPGAVTVIASGNQLPVAQNDTAELRWNRSATLNVLSNDSDADGDSLAITSVSTDFGEVAINADGTLTFTPSTNFAGTANVQYGITDGNGGTASAMVQLTVAPNLIPIAEDDSLSIDGSAPVTLNVLANDSDPDGDALTLIAASAGAGTATIVNNQVRFDAGSYIGSTTIDYEVDDGFGGSATAQVSVNVSGPSALTIENRSSGGSFTGALGAVLLSLLLWRGAGRRRPAAKCIRRSGVAWRGALAFALLSLGAHSHAQQTPISTAVSFGYASTEVAYDHPDILRVSDSDRSLSLELGYRFEQLGLSVSYIDLGQAAVTLASDSYSPEAYHQQVKAVAPVLIKGVTIGLDWPLVDRPKWLLAPQLGAVFGTNKISSYSTRTGQTYTTESHHNGAYLGLYAGYRITPQWIVGAQTRTYLIQQEPIIDFALKIARQW